MSVNPIGDVFEYECVVQIVTAHGQPVLTAAGFHVELLNALKSHFNKPTTPHYVSEVSVTGRFKLLDLTERERQ